MYANIQSQKRQEIVIENMKKEFSLTDDKGSVEIDKSELIINSNYECHPLIVKIFNDKNLFDRIPTKYDRCIVDKYLLTLIE